VQETGALAVLATLLIVKHFLADGPLQSDYQLANKGRFLHLGGVLHAGVHAALTAVCIALCFWLFSIGPHGATAKLAAISAISVLELVLHYTIDWLKCFAEKSGGWSEQFVSDDGERALLIKNEMFFHAFLADQMLHSLTYVAIIVIVARLM
jgi:hypothetical protein